LNDPVEDDRAPAYSPNGRKILFVSQRGGNNDDDIYIANADGTNVLPLVVDGAPNELDQFTPQWAPSGKQILFAQTDAGDQSVHIANADGTQIRQLTAAGGAGEYGAKFSPDGRRVIFTSDPAGPGPADVNLINPDGTNERPLIASADFEYSADFTPDGKQIVYTREVAGENQVWIANADGTGAHVLVDSSGQDQSASPTLDGRNRILFTSDRDDGSDIFVVNRDGTDQVQLTFDAAPLGNRGPEAVPTLRCGRRKATIIGTRRSETLRGGPGRDVIAGLAGRDRLVGLGAGDYLCGGAGRDRLLGAGGRDHLLGGKGLDALRGGPGRDVERQ
jgi:TolB protein